MNKFLKTVALTFSIIIVFTCAGCTCITDAIDSLPFFEDNTTIDDAVNDSREICYYVVQAQQDIKNRNSKNSVYGSDVLTENISYQDVIDKNDLKAQAETKRYNKTAYYIYWDLKREELFWSTDGKDDIRCADGTVEINHGDTIRVQRTTPVLDLK